MLHTYYLYLWCVRWYALSYALNHPLRTFRSLHSRNNFLSHSHRLEQEKVRASSSWHLKKSGAPPGVVPDELTDKASENEASPSAGKQMQPWRSWASAAPHEPQQHHSTVRPRPSLVRRTNLELNNLKSRQRPPLAEFHSTADTESVGSVIDSGIGLSTRQL